MFLFAQMWQLCCTSLNGNHNFLFKVSTLPDQYLKTLDSDFLEFLDLLIFMDIRTGVFQLVGFCTGTCYLTHSLIVEFVLSLRSHRNLTPVNSTVK